VADVAGEPTEADIPSNILTARVIVKNRPAAAR
jgi:hypothetical protein